MNLLCTHNMNMFVRCHAKMNNCMVLSKIQLVHLTGQGIGNEMGRGINRNVGNRNGKQKQEWLEMT